MIEARGNVKAAGKDKPVQGSITIGDVCRTCNNGFLSELDDYGAALYKQFFAVPPRPGQRIQFVFDYDKLLRWLLKLAYNTGRSRGWHSSLLQPLKESIPYIRSQASRPAAAILYLQLITPARLSKQQRATVEEKTGEKLDEIPPDFVRITVFGYQGIVAGYRIAMNGYVFYVLFANPSSTTAQLRTLEKRFYSETKGAKRLAPKTSKAVLYSSSLSILDVAEREPLLQATLAATTRWVEQRKKKR